MKYIFLTALVYTPGSLLFVLARRERKEAVFTVVEACIFALLTILAIFGAYELSTGGIVI